MDSSKLHIVVIINTLRRSKEEKTWKMCNVIIIMNMCVREWRKSHESQHNVMR